MKNICEHRVTKDLKEVAEALPTKELKKKMFEAVRSSMNIAVGNAIAIGVLGLSLVGRENDREKKKTKAYNSSFDENRAWFDWLQKEADKYKE